MKSREESQKRKSEKRREEQVRESQKREDAGARQGRKVAKDRVFPMFCRSGGSKSRLLKRRVRSQLARWEMNNCTPLWREAHFGSQKCGKLRTSEHFFEVQMLKKCTPVWCEALFQVKTLKTFQVRTDHCWKLRRRKSAQRCGAKHIWKSKVSKTELSKPFLTTALN